MGAAASSRTPTSSTNLSSSAVSSSKIFSSDELSRKRLKAQGMDNKEIYQHYRETYGSLRMKKRLPISENTVRGLAIQKLSNTLETHQTAFKSSSSSSSLPVTTATTTSSSGVAKKDVKKNQISPVKEEKVTSWIDENNTSPSNVAPSKQSLQESQPQTQQKKSQQAVVKKKKPNLNINICLQNEEENYAQGEGNLINAVPQNSAMKTPREYARLSPSGGALYIGDFAINEQGMKNPHIDPHHSFLTSGISDFVMIGKLGRGASGSVVEAIHIPTLTIVALKLLPIRDSEDLHHISSELGVLYQNLAELSLLGMLPDDENAITNSINEEEDRTPKSTESNHGKVLVNAKLDSSPHTVKSSCPQVLGMYDGLTSTLPFLVPFLLTSPDLCAAFLDPAAGVVNLIVEYMDGGSLQDVVDGGGCIDEEVLADLAYQVLVSTPLLFSLANLCHLCDARS
jgi:hypothetical protein